MSHLMRNGIARLIWSLLLLGAFLTYGLVYSMYVALVAMVNIYMVIEDWLFGLAFVWLVKCVWALWIWNA